MPALLSSVERSQSGGTSEPDGCRWWPFDSKYERKPSRSSALVRMRVIVRVALLVHSRFTRARISELRSQRGGGGLCLNKSPPIPRAARRFSARGALPRRRLLAALVSDL